MRNSDGRIINDEGWTGFIGSRWVVWALLGKQVDLPTWGGRTTVPYGVELRMASGAIALRDGVIFAV